MAFWQEVEAREGWGLICNHHPLCFTVSAESPFNSGHRKSNTIHISACHVRFISPWVSSVSLDRKRKEEPAAAIAGLQREKRGKKFHFRPLGGTVSTKNRFIFSCGYWGDVDPLLNVSSHPSTRLGFYNYAFINTSFTVCSLLSRWFTEAYMTIWRTIALKSQKEEEKHCKLIYSSCKKAENRLNKGASEGASITFPTATQ